MKIFICLDMEGVSGLSHFSQVDPKSEEYSDSVDRMLNDLNYVIQGAAAGGASGVVICDGHENGDNIPIDEMVESSGIIVESIRGSNSKYSMMAGIDESFGGAFFVGAHARRGSKGIMAHTYYPDCIYKAIVGGKEIGEFGINALLANHYKVPCALITGDDAACAEAKELCPQIEFAEIKKAISTACTQCIDDRLVERLLFNCARRAVEGLIDSKFSLIEELLPEGELHFFTAGQAELAAMIPESIMIDSDKVAFKAENHEKLFLMMQAGMRLANAYKG